MATGKTLSSAHAQTKRHARGVPRLQCTVHLESPSSLCSHAEGGERVATGGGQREETAIPRHGSPRQGGGDGLCCCQGGQDVTGELSWGLRRSPRQGGAMECGRRNMGGYAGRVGYAGEWPPYRGGGMLALAVERGNMAVHTCQVCFKSFRVAKALYGHMRSCRRAASYADQPPAVLGQEIEKTEKEGEYDLLVEDLARTWAVTRQRSGERIRSHGANESSSQQARSWRVGASLLQIREENLEQPWVVEMLRDAEVDLTAGDVGLSPVARGHHIPAKIPEVKVPEPAFTACNSFVMRPDATVIVIDDEEEDEPNKFASEINASSVTTAISADDAVPVVATAPTTGTTAAAVTIAPPPYVAAGMTTATAPVATTAAVTIAALPHENGGVAPASGGAGDQMKMYSCQKCFKSFFSYQGLGGHMAAHVNKERRDKEKELQNIRNVSASFAPTLNGSAVGAQGSTSANQRGVYMCPKCGKEFETGQSLGGHMQIHCAGRPLVGNAGCTTPVNSSSFLDLGPAAAGRSEMVMAAGSGFLLPGPGADTNSFPLSYDSMPNQEEEGSMATACGDGAQGRFRLFGVDIVEGLKEEPKK